MYNDSKFRQGFYWVLIAGICLQLLSTFLREWVHPLGSSDPLSWGQEFLVYTLPYLVKIGLLWGAIAYVFNLKKEVLICVVALIITHQVGAFLYKDFKGPHFSALLSLLNLFPYALFGWVVFKDRRVWSIILLGFMVSIASGVGLLGDLPATLKILLNIIGRGYMSDLNFLRITNQIDLWQLITYSLGDIFSYLLLSHTLYTLKLKHNPLSLGNIDLSNRYSKLFASVLFLVYNLILMNLFGASLHLGRSGIMLVYGILFIIGFLLTIYTIALMYRNFLVEFSLIQHGKVGWWYFLLGIPIINIFTWLFAMFKPPLVNTETQLKEIFEEERKSGDDSIKAVILFLTIILGIFLVLGARDNRLSAIISAAIGFALVAWYVSSPDGLWGLITITSVLIFLVAQGKWSIGRALSFESVVNNFVSLVVWFPLFHLWELRDVSAKTGEHSEIEEKY